MIEAHRDVGAQRLLDGDRVLGCESVKRAVEVRAERDALVVDRPEVAQADDLVAARVGQDRPLPGHELVQPAEPFDPFVARSQIQVVRVAQDDLGADLDQIVGIERLDRRVCAHRHEDRRLDVAVGRVDVAQTGARRSVGGRRKQNVEGQRPARAPLPRPRRSSDLLPAQCDQRDAQ